MQRGRSTRNSTQFGDEIGTTSMLAVASIGSVSQFLGQMATLMRDWQQVEVDFARAMRRNLETGARGEVAETRFDWASALLRRGAARDRERARAMMEAAARGATELGMEPLRRRVADALAGLEAGPSPLTSRELEVAALVAEGYTNKEVAAQLRLSVRTAENHLLNVMNKLGLDNRAQVSCLVHTDPTNRGTPYSLTAPAEVTTPCETTQPAPHGLLSVGWIRTEACDPKRSRPCPCWATASIFSWRSRSAA